MRTLWHVFQFDLLLLRKYNILLISLIVTGIYIGVFSFLRSFGEVEKFLVLVIFNDPALLGFLFIGVMVLFEKNEHTLQALAVTPIRAEHYILSKAGSLTLLSLGCCYAMVLAGYGPDFQFFHFTLATIVTTWTFSMLGFIVVAPHDSFNRYIFTAIGVILLLTLPFTGYFDLVPDYWFVLFPTWPAIRLFDLAFTSEAGPMDVGMAYGLGIVWSFGSWVWAKHKVNQKMIRP